MRLIVWSVLSLGVGAVLAAAWSDPWGRSHGVLHAGWAVVNLIIAAAGWKGSKPLELSPFREFLALNLGLNVGYIGVGIALGVLGEPGVSGAGWAVAIQGAALLVLDGWLMAQLPTPGSSGS